MWPGRAEERCGSATKTVARDAGASSPHQVLAVARLGYAWEEGGLRELLGGGDAGSGRLWVSSLKKA